MTAAGATGRALAANIIERIEATGLPVETQNAIRDGLAAFSAAVAMAVLDVVMACPKDDRTMATSLFLGGCEESLKRAGLLITAAAS